MEIKDVWDSLDAKCLAIIADYINPAPVLSSGELANYLAPPRRTKAAMSFQDQLKVGVHRLRKAKRAAGVKKKKEAKNDMFGGLKAMLASHRAGMQGDDDDQDDDDDSDFD